MHAQAVATATDVGRIRVDPPPAPGGDEREQFICAMGAAANGVNVLTTDGPAGRFGLTVSAVCSVSADPPLLLACINRRSPVRAAVRVNGVFCVNLLSTRQRHVSDTFAGRPQRGPAYDFGCAEWIHRSTAAPVLVGAVASFDCTVHRAYDTGSHTIFIGAVQTAISGCDQPLVYTRRAYGRISLLNESDRYKYCT